AFLAAIPSRLLQISFSLRFDQLGELVDKPELFRQHLWREGERFDLLSADELARKISDKFEDSTVGAALAVFAEHRLALDPERAEALLRDNLPRIVEAVVGEDKPNYASLRESKEALSALGSSPLILDFLRRLDQGEKTLEAVAEAIDYFRERAPRDPGICRFEVEFNLRDGACREALAACHALVALEPNEKGHATKYGQIGSVAEKKGWFVIAQEAYRAAAALDKTKGYDQKAKAAEKAEKGAKEKAVRDESAKLLAAWKKAEKDLKQAAALYDLIDGDPGKIDSIAAKPSLNFVSKRSALALFRRLEELAIERGEESLAQYYLYQQNTIISAIFEQVARNNAIDQERADIIYELLKNQEIAEIEQSLAETLYAVAKDKAKRYHLLAKDILWNYGFDAANDAYAKGLGVKCLAHLLICQELRPEDFQVKHNLSVVLTFLGVQFIEIEEYAEAEKYFRRALSNEPNCFPALEKLGYLLAKRGALDEAEAVCRRALDVEVKLPNEQQARIMAAGRAQVYNNLFAVALNRFEASGDEAHLSPAEEHLKRAIAILPKVAKFRFNLAIAQLLKGDFTAALGWMTNYQAGEEVKSEWVLSFMRQVIRRLALHEADRGNEQIGQYLTKACDHLMAGVQADPANKQLADDFAQRLEGCFYLGYPMLGAKGLDHFMTPEWAGSEAQACALRVKEELANPART
ncbi:MAG: tetratricopeptide repeat protein, partial [Candidatus Margulisiibacteriota bacterium]